MTRYQLTHKGSRYMEYHYHNIGTTYVGHVVYHIN